MRITVSDPGTFLAVTRPKVLAPKERVTLRVTLEVPAPAPRPHPARTRAAPATPRLARSRPRAALTLRRATACSLDDLEQQVLPLGQLRATDAGIGRLAVDEEPPV